MSCFVVPDFHIDALVSWAVANHAGAFIDGLSPRELAAELHRANCAAYRERYGENSGEGYTFTMRPEVHAMPAVERIRDHAIAYVPGYRAAAWTLEEVAA